MNKKRKSKRRKQNERILICLCVVLGIVIAIFIGLILKDLKKDNEDGKSEKKEPGLTFPYQLEEGKLEVASLFQFTGTNPDCNNENGENIAALQVSNKSEEYLKQAEIKAQLTNGTELVFEVIDVPAGQSVIVFEKKNTVYELSDVCKKIECTAEFEDEAPLLEDQISISVEEMSVVVTNKSDQELSNLVLHCHCLLDNEYFGGLTYKYPVESIPGGASVTVEAVDCYLGEAAVVRISQE